MPENKSAFSRKGMPGRLSKGEKTKQRVFESAYELFALKGYERVSIRDIAAKAGVTHATVIHYVVSKEQLLADLMKIRDEEVVSGLAHDIDFQEVGFDCRGLRSQRLCRFMYQLTLYAEQDLEVPHFLRITSEAIRADHPAHKYFEHRYRTVLNWLEAALGEEYSCHSGPMPVDARTAASLLVAVSDGMQFQAVYSSNTAEWVERTWNFLELLGVAEPSSRASNSGTAD